MSVVLDMQFTQCIIDMMQLFVWYYFSSTSSCGCTDCIIVLIVLMYRLNHPWDNLLRILSIYFWARENKKEIWNYEILVCTYVCITCSVDAMVSPWRVKLDSAIGIFPWSGGAELLDCWLPAYLSASSFITAVLPVRVYIAYRKVIESKYEQLSLQKELRN